MQKADILLNRATPGPMAKAFKYIPLEVRLSNREAPVFLTVPFRLKDAAMATTGTEWSMAASLRNWRGSSFR